MSGEQQQLDQCLFGYDDGHRLLASSIDLGPDVSMLTQLSDLAPGAVFGRTTGYWTGVPVPGLRRYALMRTWPAPEMSRPGCVWTHALLLRPELFERVPDLVALAPLLVRPAGLADRPRYRNTIALAPPGLHIQLETTRTPGGLVRELLASLYDGRPPFHEIGEPGEIDDAVFAVWSQQWPRLRRNLRFQTAATREQRSNGTARFDVAFVLQPDAPRRESTSPDLLWLDAAEDDAAARTGGALRSFLWRFGADVRRQRGSFRPLVEVWLLDGEADDVGAKVLEVVTGNFPDLEDAGSLKRALVDGEILPKAQLEILWYVLAQGGSEVFPAPTEAGVSRLALLWPERPGDLLHMAEKTADADDALGRSVFATVTSALPTDGFWRLVGPYPRLCQRMVQSRPELLLSGDAVELDDGTLAGLVDTLPGNSSVGEALVSRLLGRESDRLADMVLDRFGVPAAAQVLVAIDAGSVRVGRAWFRALVGRPALLLNARVMGRITRTSLLYELADALGWLAPSVVAAGTDPWIAALVDVASDLPDDRRDVLRSFLVALAISSGGDGGRRVLEKFFAAVHEAEMRSRLPWRARELLIHALPDIGWSRAWDYGLRLRMAAALAYVRNGYPPESYGGLLGGRKGRALMADAASRVQGGKSYARAAEG